MHKVTTDTTNMDADQIAERAAQLRCGAESQRQQAKAELDRLNNPQAPLHQSVALEMKGNAERLEALGEAADAEAERLEGMAKRKSKPAKKAKGKGRK